MQNKRKILIHSIAFSPDGVSTAYLYNDIAKGFKAAGYDVVVLTTTPHYNVIESEVKKQPLRRRLLGLYYESDFEGIKVLHVPQKKFKSTFLRLIGFVFWHIMALFLGIKERKVAGILSPSPPLTIGFINLIIGKIKGAKVIYNVQEIYPDFLIEQGGLKSKSLIKLLKWLERFVYNKSDAVTTIDDIFYNTIASRFDNVEKLHIIPNFVDTELYKPIEGTLGLNDSVFLHNDNIKLMYAGNIGHAQDWMPLIQIAIQLKNEPFDFYVIGEGVMKSYVEDQVRINGLNNVHVLPYQPRETMPNLIAFADLQYIFMSKEMEGHGFPSKVYTIMACGKPLLVCSGEGTPIVNFLKSSGCASLITSSRFEIKIQEIVAFLRSNTKETLKAMGANGYKTVHENYTKEIVVNKYIWLVNNLLK